MPIYLLSSLTKVESIHSGKKNILQHTKFEDGKKAFMRHLLKNVVPLVKFNLLKQFLKAVPLKSMFQIIWRHPQQKLTLLNWS